MFANFSRMSDSSYNPELNSSDEEGPSHGHNVSFTSLRSHGSQMSIDSAGEVLTPATPCTPCSQSLHSFSLASPRLSKRKSKVYSAKKRTKVGVAKAKKLFPKPLRIQEVFKFPEPLSEPELVDVQDYPRPRSNFIIDAQTFQTALDSLSVCCVCFKGTIQIFQTTNVGSALHLRLQCNRCSSYKSLWSVSGKYKTKLQIGQEQIPKRNDLMYTSVLAGWLIGVGWSKLHMYLSCQNIPGPMTSRNFLIVQSNILVAAKHIANESMDRARDELRALRQLDSATRYVTAVGTFDGAYLQRSGKSGGGFSRYCFAAAIIADTGNRGVRRGGTGGHVPPSKISVPPSSVHPLACAPFPCPNR